MADAEQEILEGKMQAEAARQELELENLSVAEDRAVYEGLTLGEEVEYANQLAAEQQGAYEEVGREVDSILEEGRSFKRPSLFKYGICLFWGIIADALDIIAALIAAEVITMAAIPLSGYITACINITIIFIFWFTDSKFKNAKHYVNNLQSRLEQIQAAVVMIDKNLGHVANVAGKTFKWGRRFGAVGKLATRTKSIAKVTKSPMFKLVTGALLDCLPLIEVLPFTTISILLSYWDERSVYKNAKKSAEENLGDVSGEFT